MFPKDFNFDEILNNDSLKTKNKQTDHVGAEPLFDFSKHEFVLVDGRNVMTTQIQAIKQWIELFIRTEVNKYRIYSDTYGVNKDGIVGYRGGRLHAFRVSEIQRQIKEGVMNKLPCIESVREMRYERGHFYFTVRTNTGEEVKGVAEVDV